jgi:hypothetical protein
MKRIALILIALSLVLAPVFVSAGPLPPDFAQKRADAIATNQPYALLVIDQRVIDLSSHFTPVAGTDQSQLIVDLSQYGIGQEVNALTGGGPSLAGGGPFISFGATTVNLVPGPTTFSFLFGTPITPGNYTNATSTGGVTVTNGASGTTTVNNSVVYPTYISGYGNLGAVDTNLGVDLGTGAVIASGAPFQVTTTRALGTLANAFAPTNFDGLEALLTYTQDDTASVSSWSGAVTLDIPEPATVGILACGVMVMRRRRVVSR